MTAPAPSAEPNNGRRRLVVLIALVAIAVGFAGGIAARDAIWEGWVTDRLFQVNAQLVADAGGERQPVAVVGLDRAALSSDKLASVPRVFMTPVLAKAGQALIDAGATAVGYDFIFAFSADAFTDPSTGEARLRGFDRPFLGFLYKNRGKVFVARTSTGTPHRAISAAAGTQGVRLAEVTPHADGVVRRHVPEEILAESPHFIDALMAAGGVTHQEPYQAVPTRRLATSLPYLSLLDVLSLLETQSGRERLREFAEGRIVLFGSTLPNEDEHLYSDRFLPWETADAAETGESGRPPVRHVTAGVYVLADLIGAPLSGRTAVDPPTGTRFVLSAGFAAAGTLAGLMLPLVSLPILAAAGVLVGLAVSLAGLHQGLLIAPGAAPVAFAAAMIIAAIGKVGLLQRRERALVRLFGHYLSPEVIKGMAAAERLPDLGGETRPVVVAFIDIVGFTKMSESLPDQDVVRVVNRCFDAIGRVITDHHGYIDKYIGDAIMAVWNAPNTVEDPEKAAVDAAVEIIGLLGTLRVQTGQRALDLRIALNAGPVLVGDIGGEHRRSFTVMGTTVNTASRIESVAKDCKVRLAMSGTVADHLPQAYPRKQIWTGQLRGLTQDTSVYTLDIPEMQMVEADPPPAVAPTEMPAKLLRFPKSS